MHMACELYHIACKQRLLEKLRQDFGDAEVVDAPPSLVSPGGVPVVTPLRPSILILIFRWQRSRLPALAILQLVQLSLQRLLVEAGTGDGVKLLALSSMLGTAALQCGPSKEFIQHRTGLFVRHACQLKGWSCPLTPRRAA
jgi:hypothetical protein